MNETPTGVSRSWWELTGLHRRWPERVGKGLDQRYPETVLEPLGSNSGCLFQQHLVDMWAAAKQNRLNYLCYHQNEIRASLYSGLANAINNNTNLNDIGQWLILPSSYTGSPRYMKQCLQDSLALARYFQQIDLFITVTCNPNWPEITCELLPGQTAADRPDLCARVFHMKLKVIIEEIHKKGIFGKTVAYIYTIEFQKRGLPHAHILVFLKDGDKICQGHSHPKLSAPLRGSNRPLLASTELAW